MAGDESAVGVEDGGVEETGDEAAEDDDGGGVGQGNGGAKRVEEAGGAGMQKRGCGFVVQRDGEGRGCGACSMPGETKGRHLAKGKRHEDVLLVSRAVNGLRSDLPVIRRERLLRGVRLELQDCKPCCGQLGA